MVELISNNHDILTIITSATSSGTTSYFGLGVVQCVLLSRNYVDGAGLSVPNKFYEGPRV
jgi:hypothetical protein